MRFSVSIVSSKNDIYSGCFEDVALALEETLVLCGHDVVPVSDAKPGRLIAFGCDRNTALTENAIIFNAEQVSSSAEEYFKVNIPRFCRHIVWDYAQINVDWFRARGVSAVLCPIGYVPSMEKIIPSSSQDIDVLWYGAENDRRRDILNALDNAGLVVKRLTRSYGKERDAWIARSKVILNLHYYDSPVFEIFRVSHLLANKKAVVSENGSIDSVLEDFARRSCILTEANNIVDACINLCKDDAKRREYEIRGYEEFKKISFVDSVRAAIKVS